MKIAITHDPHVQKNYKDEINTIRAYHDLIASSIVAALINLGHQVEICETNDKLERKLREIKPGLVFNTSISSKNGDGYAYAPGILEKNHIPFTGPSAKACANAYDKLGTIEILDKAGIKAPLAVSFSEGDKLLIPSRMKYPLFIKPRKGGCSRGISSRSFIKTPDDFLEKIREAFEEINEPVIVEEFLPGREFSVGILGNQPIEVLTIIEFVYEHNEIPFRSYSRKMVNYEIEGMVCPAQLKDVEKKAIENLAVSAFQALECRDYARIDIRMDAQGEPFILEVNAIPNLEPNSSSFALMAKYAGISFEQLIEKILNFALKRYEFVDSEKVNY
jgi:D-alanine-D-alanine ligase